jgi:hypothetical protein
MPGKRFLGLRDFSRFVGACLATAFKHSKSTLDLFACATGMVLPFVVFLHPKWLTPAAEHNMNALYFVVPMSAATLVVLARLAISPYWVFVAERTKVKAKEGEIDRLRGQLAEQPLLLSAQKRQEKLEAQGARTDRMVIEAHLALLDGLITQIKRTGPFDFKEELNAGGEHPKSVELIKTIYDIVWTQFGVADATYFASINTPDFKETTLSNEDRLSPAIRAWTYHKDRLMFHKGRLEDIIRRHAKP